MVSFVQPRTNTFPGYDGKLFFKLHVRISTLAQLSFQQNCYLEGALFALHPCSWITLQQRQKQGVVKVCSYVAGIPLNDHHDLHKGRAPEEERDQSWQIGVVPCGVNPCCFCQNSDTICHHVELRGFRVIHSCRSQPWKFHSQAQLQTVSVILRIYTCIAIVDLLFTVN